MKNNVKLLPTTIIVTLIAAGAAYLFFMPKNQPNPVPKTGDQVKIGDQIKPIDQIKTIDEAYCNQYVPDACPDGCVVCPPCEVCSSIKCRLEVSCSAIGFDKNWYQQTKPPSDGNKTNDTGSTNNSGNIVGNDRDEHGCIGSAGYSWCEEKQKCLRVWEEPCVDKNAAVCARENCHGLDIKCGPNPAEICTMMYQLGDKCLQYAKCEIVSGQCQQITDPQFDACKACVQKCETDFATDQINLFNCESACPPSNK